MIILLDLNYTLVANSPQRGTSPPPMARRLQDETYRLWLVRLVRPHHVILVTARPDRWREATLERIRVLTGWEPQESYFNDGYFKPPVWKEQVLRNHIVPRFGFDNILAIESNPKTRKMYGCYGIRAVPVEEKPWTKLPV